MDNKPPKFSDVLGALVMGVAHGRKVADVGALHIARSYYKNDLLRGLPIPRLRIDKVSISLPLMLSDVIEGDPAEPNEPEEIANKAAEAFKKELEIEKDDLDVLKSQIENGELTEEQEQELNIYEQFLGLWEKSESQKEDKDGISIFKEEFCKQVKSSFIDLERTEGGVKPSDIDIIDASANAAEKVLKDLMEKFLIKLHQDQQEDRHTVEIGKETVYSKKEALKEAMTEDLIDVDTVFELLATLSEVTFNGSISKQAKEVNEFNKIWKQKVSEAKDKGKINEKVADYLTNDNTRELPGAIQPVKKYDKNWAKETLKELLDDYHTTKLISSVKDAAGNAAIKSSTVPPDFFVVVNTENIKNAGGGPEVVTRLNITLHEEGLEWTSEKDKTKLIPE